MSTCEIEIKTECHDNHASGDLIRITRYVNFCTKKLFFFLNHGDPYPQDKTVKRPTT